MLPNMIVEDTSDLKYQLEKAFGDTMDSKLLEECCIQLCKSYQLDGEDLFYKWESIRSALAIQKLNMESINELKQFLSREADPAKNIKKQQMGGNLNGLMSKNLTQLLKSSIKPIGTGPRVEEIPVPYIGSSIVTVKPSVTGISRVKLDPGRSLQYRRYKYMYEKVSERSEVLDDHIDTFAELIQSHYGIGELGDPSTSTEDEITVVGRIALDSDSANAISAKLNEASLTLESSRAMGSGARVSIKFDPNIRVREGRKGVGGAGFFPGAIVALRGKNGGGGWFNVTEILSLPPASLRQEVPTRKIFPFTIFIACGPFTPDTDLKYDAWSRLVTKIKEEKPDVILLTGPFVEAAHPLVKSGSIDKLPIHLFQEIFMVKLRDILDADPGVGIILIPSVRDIISNHTVFPQSELDVDFNDPRVVFLPNPSQFNINGVSFAASSVDVLFHLRKEEFFKRASEIQPVLPQAGGVEDWDAMSNLCRHILRQRSFYPLFPVPLEASHEVNLDMSHSEHLRLSPDPQQDYAPDVLILPSKLKHFSKVIDQTRVVNPSFVAKGMFATLRVTDDGSLGSHIEGDVMRLE